METPRSWSRRLAAACIGLVAGIVDATVIVWFPGVFGAMRWALPGVITLAVFSSLDRALIAAVVAGVVIDVLQPSFGFTSLRLVIVCIVVRLVSQRVLTNRSLVGSVVLGIIGLLSDRIALFGITWLAGLFSATLIPDVRVVWWIEAAWVSGCMAGIFFVFAAFTKRFLPFFTRR